jgi:hypothetical protein
MGFRSVRPVHGTSPRSPWTGPPGPIRNMTVRPGSSACCIRTGGPWRNAVPWTPASQVTALAAPYDGSHDTARLRPGNRHRPFPQVTLHLTRFRAWG